MGFGIYGFESRVGHTWRFMGSWKWGYDYTSPNRGHTFR